MVPIVRTSSWAERIQAQALLGLRCLVCLLRCTALGLLKASTRESGVLDLFLATVRRACTTTVERRETPEATTFFFIRADMVFVH